MKDLEFRYEKVGHIIMLEEDDWNRIVKYLAKSGIRVDEASLTKRATDTPCVKCGGRKAHKINCEDEIVFA